MRQKKVHNSQKRLKLPFLEEILHLAHDVYMHCAALCINFELPGLVLRKTIASKSVKHCIFRKLTDMTQMEH